ncbi:MAG: alpha/beta hydrolase [Comamonadaceae bacterium]|nr:MAG: alpha/beta hydrolase [Comamonadaceae bacterium]
MKTGSALIAAALHLCAATAWAQGPRASEGLTETLHTLRLARGSELPVLVSKRTGTSPSVAVLIFPGYPGILRLRTEGGAVVHALGGNFLVRARRFLNTEKVFTVLVDCPVDQWHWCGDAWRSGAQHAGDIAEVVEAARQVFGAQRVFLAGTSYGTVSTSFLARSLEGKIDGAVHTATFTDPRLGREAHGAPMRGFDWSRAKVPQLFVHHRQDPCGVTSYESVVRRRGEIPLVTVEGGEGARGEPCEAFSAHGFVGREREAMGAIHQWITTGAAPAIVGAR